MKIKTLFIAAVLCVAKLSHAGAVQFPLHEYVITVESKTDHQTHYILVGDPIDKAVALLNKPYETFIVETRDGTLYLHQFNYRGMHWQLVVGEGSNEILAIDPVY